MKANASKHKAMSYGRMREKQRQLRAEVTALARAGRGGGCRGGRRVRRRSARRRIAGGTAAAESRLARIREAKRALEARAKEEATAAGEPPDDGEAGSEERSTTSPIPSRGS